MSQHYLARKTSHKNDSYNFYYRTYNLLSTFVMFRQSAQCRSKILKNINVTIFIMQYGTSDVFYDVTQQ